MADGLTSRGRIGRIPQLHTKIVPLAMDGANMTRIAVAHGTPTSKDTPQRNAPQ
jgi:hypothetical protein